MGKKLKMKNCKTFIILLMVMMDNSAKTEEVNCQEKELNNVKILFGHPGIDPPYRSGHVLLFKCTDVNMTMFGQRAIECQSDGKWDNPYPQCREATCVANTTNMIIEGHPDAGVPYKPGDRLKVSCVQRRGLVLQGQNDITCQEDGEWSSPFPTCVVKTSCGPPPNMNHQNADTAEMLDPRKTEYKSGDKVEYTCFSTYTMDGDPHLTCLQGIWRGDIKCIQPCLASVEEMDRRNIQSAFGGREKIFCPHKDHITFVCQSDKRKKKNSVAFRQQCQYGKMTLPECE